MLLFLEKKRAGKPLEPAMNSEGTMGMSTEQDISIHHSMLMSFLINRNPILEVNNIA